MLVAIISFQNSHQSLKSVLQLKLNYQSCEWTCRLNLHICHLDLSVRSRCPYSLFGFVQNDVLPDLINKVNIHRRTSYMRYPIASSAQGLHCSIFLLSLLWYLHWAEQ